ncbi:MAG: glycosyltransferase family 2 protein [Candidatus Omnitrophica bacterium]|nr:glycosyltransferase family 2 protein [Candidatus Omnitrophota bacterium]
MKVNIIVLNYNGMELLKECLPSIMEASKKTSHECRVTVLDNRSTDDSEAFIRKNFPEAVVYVAGSNRVFCSFNEIAGDVDDDILVLMNNDIKVEPDFIDPLIGAFQAHEDAFLAGPKCLMFDGKTYDGAKSKWWLEKGMLKSGSRYEGYEAAIDKEGYTMQAGFGAFDRKKFIELGGFDDLYLPGIAEDMDLCYRAWKKGYKGYYEPRSLIYHIGQASFKKAFGSRKIMELAHRNTLLFMWKNMADARIILGHILWLPARMVYSLLTGRIEFVSAFFKALSRLSSALSRRRAQGPYKLTDREVLEISKGI